MLNHQFQATRGAIVHKKAFLGQNCHRKWRWWLLDSLDWKMKLVQIFQVDFLKAKKLIQSCSFNTFWVIKSSFQAKMQYFDKMATGNDSGESSRKSFDKWNIFEMIHIRFIRWLMVISNVESSISGY